MFRFACLLASLLALAYLAEVASVEVVSAGDFAFLQSRNCASEGGEAEDGCEDGGEVDHFLGSWRGRLGSVCRLSLGEVVVVGPERL